ncbi:alpha/beta hydrolase [Stappia sp. F7233]|uniref:Alpha/beta hydrolase n=1 Tax=Stappia albiluteola TaxID=2758565 RepID=A0A839A9A7_9HYPH|nr:alpha/beta hydrolase [Stappia albiluteola]MBA5775931.1 alpha/beta hydrolase [Stappia albiluteola]
MAGDGCELAVLDNPSARGSAAAGAPCYVDGMAAMLHGATGKTGVLFLSPWGFEELCARKAYRLMAERIAGNGYPALRFDYPGTGDSAPLPNDTGGWTGGARKMLTHFKKTRGLDRVVLVGQGLGGLVAARLAASEPDIAGLALLAPVSAGKGYLRALAAWTAFTQPTFKVAPDEAGDGSLTSAGFVLSPETISEIRSLDIKRAALPENLPVLLVKRFEHPADDAVEEHLVECGTAVRSAVFAGYDAYTSDPTLSEVPSDAIATLANWISDTFEPGKASAAIEPAPARLDLGGCVEEACRFGEDGRLFGILTRPMPGPAKAGVVLLNSGYDHHIGWAGAHVEMARKLAGEGFATLRIDASGIGESPLMPGQGAQILYSDAQIADVREAVALLKAHGIGKVVVSGRCSGAYLALISSVALEDVDGMVMVNSRRFAWNPRQDVDIEIRKPVQPLKSYQRKLRDPRVLKRALSSPKAFRESFAKLVKGVARPFFRAMAPLLGPLSMHNRLDRQVQRRMASLRRRDVPTLIVYSENDPGLEELASYFGADYRRMEIYRNARLVFVPDADHNLTPKAARQLLLRETSALLRQLAGSAGNLDERTDAIEAAQ